MNGKCGSSIRYTWRSGRILRCGLTEGRTTENSRNSVLLICNRQKNAVIHGNGASEERGCVCARYSDAPCIATQNGAGGSCSRSRPITWLKRNPGRLRRAVGGAEAGVADEDLSVAAVAVAHKSLRLRGRRLGGMAGSKGQKCDKTSRGADRRQNTFRSH